MGIHGHKYVPSGRGQVAGTAIGELKVPMEDLTVQTTDEEAQKRGFESAEAWYHYSTGGAMSREASDDQYRALPPPGQGTAYSQDPSAAQSFAMNTHSEYADDVPEAEETISPEGWDIERPFFLADVEPLAREHVEFLATQRDMLHEAVTKVWRHDTLGGQLKVEAVALQRV